MTTIKKLSDVAYDNIKESIITLESKPGEILYELQLSKKYKISRTPIRSALQILATEGLVNIKPGKKDYFYVSELSLELFQDIYQVRNALEILSIELATLHRTNEDIEKLEKLLQIHSTLSTEESTIKKMLDIDRNIHHFISKMSGNNLLSQQLKNVIDLYYRYNYFTLESAVRARQSSAEHFKILDAIKEQNPEKAKHYMEMHLSKTNEHILLGAAQSSNFLMNQ